MTDFPAELRSVLAELAELMIPAGAGLPSANEVDISGTLLDQVLTVRPDLTGPLHGTLTDLRRVPASNRLMALQQDPDAMDVVGMVMAGGYLMSRQVVEVLRYPFQEAKLVRPDDVFQAIDDGLLDGVVDRGPIYRTPPGRDV